MMDIQVKRIYDEPSQDDGCRILVDRLWPRGVSKSKAALDCWAQDIAPSTELRKWFGHHEERFQTFKEYYLKEIQENPHCDEFLSAVRDALDTHAVTLLYAAHSETCNHAIILQGWLREQLHTI